MVDSAHFGLAMEDEQTDKDGVQFSEKATELIEGNEMPKDSETLTITMLHRVMKNILYANSAQYIKPFLPVYWSLDF